MPRRIEIELTSKVDDDTWTWRAAGAKLPKGTMAAKLLPEGAKVTDVLRAEVQDDIDGIAVLAILPSKEKAPEPERIQILAPEERRTPPPPPTQTARGARPAKGAPSRGARPERGRPEGRPARPARAAGSRPRSEPAPEKPKPKRLNPGHTHRNAVLESLPPEERAIAEQVLRGGIPAVRQAIDTQNEQLKAGGQSAIKADPLLTLAEELLPRLKGAEWQDRAEAANAAGEDITLRDLRSVVGSADAARDDEARLLGRSLRENLDRRLKLERDAWVTEIGDALTDGRVVRALRIASRPPDPAMRFPADLGARLADGASKAMDANAAPDRWLAVLDALAVSPVRRAAKPVALPSDSNDKLVATVKQMVPRVPGLGPLVGIEDPPTPPPPPAPGSGPRRPPPPPPGRRIPNRPPPGAAMPAVAEAPSQPGQADQPAQGTESPEKAEEGSSPADT